MTFFESKRATGVNFTIESSGTLNGLDWMPVPAGAMVQIEGADRAQTRVELPLLPAGTLFLRLRLSD